jgi:hypothetical protein
MSREFTHGADTGKIFSKIFFSRSIQFAISQAVKVHPDGMQWIPAS